MIGNKKNNTELMISKEEALHLADYSIATFDNIAHDVFFGYIEQNGKYFEGLAFQFALGAVFEAGRIQGIREERAKTRQQNAAAAFDPGHADHDGHPLQAAI